MKYFFLVIFLLKLNTAIIGQSVILEELYKVDMRLNPKIEVDFITEVFRSHKRIAISPEFINPTMKSIPRVKTICHCKNNLAVNCISEAKDKLDVTTDYTYNTEGKVSEINRIDEADVTLSFEYDILGRPIKVFKETEGTRWLHESANYLDTVVNISIFKVEEEIEHQSGFPFFGHNQHIKSIETNKKRVTIVVSNPVNPDRERKIVFKLDEHGNWIKKSVFNIIKNKAVRVSTTTRKIGYW